MRGRPMINAEKVAEIRRLLAEGRTKPEVAKMAGVSLASVKKYRSDTDVERTRSSYRRTEARRSAERRADPKAAPTGRRSIKTASPVLRELFRQVWLRQLNQAELGKVIGVSHRSMTSWKLGHADPSLLSVEALAQVLGYELVLKPRE